MSYAQTGKKEVTILGEVVDVVSYVSSGMKPNSPDRRAVAEANAKAGYPIGILERGTGRIYLVKLQSPTENPAGKLFDYAGVKIFAKGAVTVRGGILLMTLSDIGKSAK
jgi:hypothetical protein